VPAALQGCEPELSPRTVRHRFLRATGQTQKHIQQFERAKQAQALLSRGKPVLDVAYQLGYYDQSHLTRSLRHFIGYTPGQLSAGEMV
jgi:AraC-like DNA-binding protein